MDYTEIYKKYKGLWILLDSDEKTVLGKGKTPTEAIKNARKKNLKKTYLFKVPTEVISYIGKG